MHTRMGAAQARQVAEELRFYREAMKVPAHVMASRLGWSPSKLSRVENGLMPVTEIDVARYTANCGGSAEMVDAMLDLCRDPGAPGYWLTRQMHSLVFHETTASFSSSYDPLVVPGLLQTEEYVTAMMEPKDRWLVPVRMERQLALRNRPFEFFIHEQALRLRIGGNRVMNEQLLKLVLVAEQPGITIRVVPAALGARSVFGGEFVLFRYERHDPLVYLEHGFLGLFLDGDEHVATISESLGMLSAVALGRGESREMLAAMAGDFDRPEDHGGPDDLAKEQLQLRP